MLVADLDTNSRYTMSTHLYRPLRTIVFIESSNQTWDAVLSSLFIFAVLSKSVINLKHAYLSLISNYVNLRRSKVENTTF